jgi:hypothetical protein
MISYARGFAPKPHFIFCFDTKNEAKKPARPESRLQKILWQDYRLKSSACLYSKTKPNIIIKNYAAY